MTTTGCHACNLLHPPPLPPTLLPPLRSPLRPRPHPRPPRPWHHGFLLLPVLPCRVSPLCFTHRERAHSFTLLPSSPPSNAPSLTHPPFTQPSLPPSVQLYSFHHVHRHGALHPLCQPSLALAPHPSSPGHPTPCFKWGEGGREEGREGWKTCKRREE